MANQPKKKNEDPQPGDPLFNLKHAQAEAELAQKNGGLGPLTNEYITTDEDEALDEGPRDNQGFRRGENEPPILGSSAGNHK
ncbi:hypothetical protein ACW9KT_05500 [Hymenobacter sp. HD11105]|jgi:hypothetical protein